jgi:predicted DNA-binding protein YlxM (UPF0122 family)
MAFSKRDWEIVRAYYERGLSLSEIVARDDVVITDRSSISRKAKAEGWIKNEKSTLLNNEIQAKQMLAEINQQKSTLNSTDVAIHDKLVDERLRHIEFFNKSALKNQHLANQKLNASLSISELEAHSRLTAKNKETVVGRLPDTAIQINNNQTPSVIERVIIDHAVTN